MCQQPLQGQNLALVAVFDCLGNTHLQPSNLLPEGLPMEGLPVPWWGERRISSGRNCHLLFFLHDGSACSLARRDQTVVCISDALHIGIGFFGHPNAVPLDPPCGEVCPMRTGRADSVSMFHNNLFGLDDLGSLSTPAVRRSRSGHQTGPEPDCLPFGLSLEQSLVVYQL